MSSRDPLEHMDTYFFALALGAMVLFGIGMMSCGGEGGAPVDPVVRPVYTPVPNEETSFYIPGIGGVQRVWEDKE